jgi:hypothetical protein
VKSPFLRSVSDMLRKKYYAKRAEETFLQWIVNFIRQLKMRYPSEMGASETADYLDWLALQLQSGISPVRCSYLHAPNLRLVRHNRLVSVFITCR